MSDRTEGGKAANSGGDVLPPSVACSDISPARGEIESSRFRFPVKCHFWTVQRPGKETPENSRLWIPGSHVVRPRMTAKTGKARVNAEVRLAISPLAGEMSDRTEGGVAANSVGEALPPSVACSDISPARGEIENSPLRFPFKCHFWAVQRPGKETSENSRL